MINPFDKFIPTNIDDARDAIKAVLSHEDIAYGTADGFNVMHHSLGRAIRNAWLWDDPSAGRIRPLAEYFRVTYGLGHADDMSGMILDDLTAELRGQPFDRADAALYYHKFWREQGVDPLTQERIVT